MSLHTFKCDDDLWDEALDVARDNDDNVSRVLRAALRAYVAKQKRKR